MPCGLLGVVMSGLGPPSLSLLVVAPLLLPPLLTCRPLYVCVDVAYCNGFDLGRISRARHGPLTRAPGRANRERGAQAGAMPRESCSDQGGLTPPDR